jgi:hypothetical protein
MEVLTIRILTAILYIIIFETNPLPMKKSILKAIALTFVMCLVFSSCELLDCKTCELVTTTSGVETARGPEILACGDELADNESYSLTIGYNYTYYDCN